MGAVLVAGSFLPIRRGLPMWFSQRWLDLTGAPPALHGAVCAASSLVAVALVPRRVWPLLAVAALAWLSRGVWTPLGVASYLIATRPRRPAVLAAYGGGASVLVVLPDFATAAAGALPWSDAVGAVGGAALFVWLPFAVGLWVGARRQVLDGLRDSARERDRRERARAEEVRVKERARIARDMHDVVAHRVSLMVLHAGALEVNTTDEKAAAAAALIRTTGREALAQLRDVLGVLRSGEQVALEQLRPSATLAGIDALLEQSRAAGIPVRRVDEGDPRDLPVLVQHAAYRVVQEALTNVHKHAGQVPTEVVVRYLPAALEVIVSNEVIGRPPPRLPGGGLGLVGLRERVEVLGGRFTARRGPAGFSVNALLPSTSPGERP
ncbi:Signal transduction histidine kinase [Actinokineospora diospyrosa]|uniref:histidine kinase n=1 Tax=Actinokineospora diospyrosa TaxID=103728 RepID=A0ABT1IEI6_9PSEU|nr:Signal transduction histidine kinase [Actinokineospora diospyrosa]